VNRRVFVHGTGLLAGLLLTPLAFAGEAPQVTGRVVLVETSGEDMALEIWLTNQGPTPDDVRTYGGPAEISGAVKLGRQAVTLSGPSVRTRAGPRPGWTALPVSQEVMVGRYSTDIAKGQKGSLKGTLELTLTSGPLLLDLAKTRSAA
jgi:hypothetical protein